MLRRTTLLALLAAASALTTPPTTPRPLKQLLQPLAANTKAAAQQPLARAAAAATAFAAPLAALADDGGFQMPAWLDSKEAHELGIYFAQTLISWGVPAAVAGAFVIAVISSNKGGDSFDQEPPQLPAGLAKALGVEEGPKEYLQIERLNTKLQSFEYSFTKASISKASALRTRSKQEIERQFGAEFEGFGLDAETVEKVFKAAKAYRRAEERVTKKLETSLLTLRASGLKDGHSAAAGGKKAKDEGAAADDDELVTKSESSGPSFGMGGMGGVGGGGGVAAQRMKGIAKLQTERLELELAFLRRLSEILTSEQAAALATVLQPSAVGGGGGADGKPTGGKPTGGKPMGGGGGAMGMGGALDKADNEAGVPRLGGRLDALSALVTAAAEAAGRAKHVYVLKFFGDVTASQVAPTQRNGPAPAPAPYNARSPSAACPHDDAAMMTHRWFCLHDFVAGGAAATGGDGRAALGRGQGACMPPRRCSHPRLACLSPSQLTPRTAPSHALSPPRHPCLHRNRETRWCWCSTPAAAPSPATASPRRSCCGSRRRGSTSPSASSRWPPRAAT